MVLADRSSKYFHHIVNLQKMQITIGLFKVRTATN